VNAGYILGISAGILQIAGYFLYIQQMLKGKSKPNTVSWTLWFFLIILNTASYFQMSDDWVKSIIPLVSSLMMLIIYAVLVFKTGTRFNSLTGTEWAVLITGLMVCIGWWHFKSATLGNLLFQLLFIISFLPTINGVRRNSATEEAPAWLLFSAAYFLGILIVFFRWQGQIQDLVFPINAFFLHSIVAVLSLRKIQQTRLDL
jgi:hypothetical protein